MFATIRTATPRRRFAALAAAAALALSLTACSSAPTDTPSTPIALPDTAVAGQTEWVIDTISAPSGPAVLEEDRFSDVIYKEITPDKLGEILEQMRAQGPWTPVSHDGSETQATTRITSENAPAINLQLSVDKANQIDGIFFGATQ